jgi:hypothetical protein
MATIWEPLDLQNPLIEVRILTILPGHPDDTIRCMLEKSTLTNHSKYTALSYCWGDVKETTNILVDNVTVAITANLADALWQLRRLEISRVWVDALCISQIDPKEKSFQIRYMKDIFSGAEEVYAWLGSRGTDTAMDAMEFLRSLSLGAALSIVTHNHKQRCSFSRSTDSVHQSDPEYPSIVMGYLASQTPPDQDPDSCPRCFLAVRFRSLQDLFCRPYWTRRWIIQEMAVASEVRILCGDISLSLRDFVQAVRRCLKSEYWQSDIEVPKHYFDQIMYFRRKYSMLPLAEAVILGKCYQSTDPRDKIFALLSLCHDGAALVPHPNYLQPVETILGDLTREIIARNRCLDVVTIAPSTAHQSLELPSWTPNWVSPELPTEVSSLATTCLCSSAVRPSNILLGDRKVLLVEGLIIGVVVRATSNTDLTNVPRHIGNQSTDGTQPSPARPYYISTDDIRWGLLSYLHESEDCARGFFSCDRPEKIEHGQWRDPQVRHILNLLGMKLSLQYLYQRLCVRATWNSFCIARSIQDTDNDNSARESEPPEVTARRTLNRWLATNMTFSLQGTNLEAWFSPNRSFRFILKVFVPASRVAYVLLVLWILLTFSPVIICSLVAGLTNSVNTRFRLAMFGVAFFVAAAPIAAFQVVVFREFRNHCRSDMPTFLENMVAIVASERLVITDKGSFGLACPGTEIGDKICCLLGCTKMVVLREVVGMGEPDRGFEEGNGDERGKAYYKLIGKIRAHLTIEDENFYEGFAENRDDRVRSRWIDGRGEGQQKETLQEFRLI